MSGSRASQPMLPPPVPSSKKRQSTADSHSSSSKRTKSSAVKGATTATQSLPTQYAYIADVVRDMATNPTSPLAQLIQKAGSRRTKPGSNMNTGSLVLLPPAPGERLDMLTLALVVVAHLYGKVETLADIIEGTLLVLRLLEDKELKKSLSQWLVNLYAGHTSESLDGEFWPLDPTLHCPGNVGAHGVLESRTVVTQHVANSVVNTLGPLVLSTANDVSHFVC